MTLRRHIVRLQGFFWLFLASLTITVLLVYGMPMPQTAPPPSLPAVVLPVEPPDPLAAPLATLSELFQAAEHTTVDALETRPDRLDETDSIFRQYDTFDAPPRQLQILAHPSNFGDRVRQDINRRPVDNALLVVLHETTSSTTSAIHQMLANHPRDQDQVSYHALIDRDGTLIYTVDPKKRAYGAGDSVFTGAEGTETVKTSRVLAPSVNNFAYHISLETPPDGTLNNNPFHSGYTVAQYQSLSWLIAQTGVSPSRVVTHAAVDQSGERQDPRSFDPDLLLPTLASPG